MGGVPPNKNLPLHIDYWCYCSRIKYRTVEWR